jgi:hypothetical protein
MTSLKMSFELTTVLAFCELRMRSRWALRNPRRNGNGLGGVGLPQLTVKNIDFAAFGGRWIA